MASRSRCFSFDTRYEGVTAQRYSPAPLHLDSIVPRAIKQLSGRSGRRGSGGTIRKALISWLLLFRAVCCLLSCLNPISIFMEETRGPKGGPTACCGHQTQLYQNKVFNVLTCPWFVIWSAYWEFYKSRCILKSKPF